MVAGASDLVVDSKIKLELQTWDSLTGPSTGYGIQLNVKACGPFVKEIIATCKFRVFFRKVNIVYKQRLFF